MLTQEKPDINPDDPFGEAAEEEAERERKLQEAATGIIDRLNRLAEQAVQRRKPIEKRWLEDIRALQGRYDDEVEKMLDTLQKSGNAKARAFVNMARSKANIWVGRLAELLFPADDKNWGINPTPVPELTDQAQKALEAAEEAERQAEQAAEQANAALAAGNAQAEQDALSMGQSAATKAKAFRDAYADAQKIMDEARKRAEAMEKEIEDQLAQCDYGKRARDAILDAVRLGPGILKGPVVANRSRRRWIASEPGTYELVSESDPTPACFRVDPWHFFPDWNATKIEETEWTLERHLPTSKQLKEMALKLGFSRNAVRQIIASGPSGNASNDLQFLTDLRSITNEGEAVTDRFVMWEYNGTLECEEICLLLKAIGEEERAQKFAEADDPFNQRTVTIWFCNGHLLKIAEFYLLDSEETLYSVFAFDPGEASIMGARGIPSLMHDSLRALNSAWRQMLDNSALASQPQIVVDKTQIAPENGIWRMTPGKVWTRVQQEQVGTRQPPFQTFEIPHNQAQIAGVIELALKFMDEETGLPLISQGEQDRHITQTANGMAMLMNSANVVFRRVVKNWDDDVTVPIIRRFFDWNMQFSTKQEIKGDMQIEARGTSVLLAQEMQAQNLMALATNWSVHPVLKHALRDQGYQAAAMSVQSMKISKSDIMVSVDDYRKSLAEEAANVQQSPEVIRAQASIEAAKIQAQSRAADGETQQRIAEIHRETELIKLAESRNMKLDDLRAKLQMNEQNNQSKERIFAAETAVQERQAAQARAVGEPAPGGGGGFV